METILDTMSRFANETKVALEQAISTSANNDKGGAEKGAKPDKPKKGGIGDALGRTLKHVRIVNYVLLAFMICFSLYLWLNH